MLAIVTGRRGEIRVDYKTYSDATIEEKKALLGNAVLRSIERIRKKGKIDYPAFGKDLTDYFKSIDVRMDQ